MPRPGFKGGGHRGSFRGGSARGSTSRSSAYGRSPVSDPPHAVFSLADEARSTAHGHSPWSLGSRLRSRPVNFVSAGAVDPLKQLEDQLQRMEQTLQVKAHEALGELSRQVSTAEADESTKPAHGETHMTVVKGIQGTAFSAVAAGPWDGLGPASGHGEVDYPPPETVKMPSAPRENSPLNNTASAENDEAPAIIAGGAPPSPLPFYIDITGDPSHHKQSTSFETSQPAPAHESGTDSSEDVILFKGRNQPRPRVRPTSSKNPSKMGKKQKEKTFDLEDIRAEVHLLVAKANNSSAAAEAHSAQSTESSYKPKKKKKNKKYKKAEGDDLQGFSKQADEDEALADYVANMRENGDDEDLIPRRGHVRRDLGGSDMDIRMADSSDPAADHDMSGTGADAASPAEPAVLIGDGPRSEDNSKQHVPGVADTTDNDFILAHLLAADEIGGADRSEDDDHDSFDFMEWGDPITKRMRKQKKGKLPVFDVSDSELEATLQSAYKNDRLKKAERKKDREKLRAQGLLGKNIEPDDLRVKYPQGMGLEQIAEELENFLKSSQTSLTLPPMDNHARKVMHELANKFNIKSKSTGSGDQRRPTLYRTIRTFQYSEDVFDRAISRVGRKYFPRKDLAFKGSSARGSARRGGGQADISYRDGEVVGGSAPELGLENRGRAMLEKMGWSTGTALGSMTNKGILQPVEQKVKRGKAGLG